jgi:hypothetical protein
VKAEIFKHGELTNSRKKAQRTQKKEDQKNLTQREECLTEDHSAPRRSRNPIVLEDLV